MFSAVRGCLPLYLPSGSGPSRWKRLLRRLAHPSQLDIQYSAAQFKLLLLRPSRLYSLVHLRQQQQQSCAREDPAFLVLLLLFLLLLGIGQASALHAMGASAFSAASSGPALLFTFTGVLVVAVTVLLKNGLGGRSLEAAFCFDVHCNGSFLYAVYAQLLPLVLLPVLRLFPVFFRAGLSGVLHCVGLCFYAYASCLGFMAVGHAKAATPLLALVLLAALGVCAAASAGVDLSVVAGEVAARVLAGRPGSGLADGSSEGAASILNTGGEGFPVPDLLARVDSVAAEIR